jgi:hypothetical protein
MSLWFFTNKRENKDAYQHKQLADSVRCADETRSAVHASGIASDQEAPHHSM